MENVREQFDLLAHGSIQVPREQVRADEKILRRRSIVREYHDLLTRIMGPFFHHFWRAYRSFSKNCAASELRWQPTLVETTLPQEP